MTVAPAKVNRALSFLHQILNGALVTFDQYRRLIGLLEHMLLFVGGDRTFMYGLYGSNFQRGNQHGPSTRMIFRDFQLSAIRRWTQTLMLCGGSFFSIAMQSPSIPVPQLPTTWLGNSNIFGARPIKSQIVSLFSDAFADPSAGGLGGYAHGSFWHIPLSAGEVSLMHITAWEFLAVGINLIMFGSLFEGHEVYLLADALASVQVLANNAARSPTMQIIHDLILNLPEFKLLHPHLYSTHVFGHINVLADAASRASFDVIYSISYQMGIQALHLKVSQRAFDFFTLAKTRIQALRDQDMHESSTQCSSPRVRPQTRQELELMHHLGSPFIGAEDQPLMFKFSIGKRSLDHMSSSEMGCRIDAKTQLTVNQRPSPLHGWGIPTQLRLPDLTYTELMPNEQHQSIPPSKINNTRQSQNQCLPLRPSIVPLQHLPPIPSSHTLLDEVLAGRSRPKESILDVYEILSKDTSAQALRPRDPSLLRAYADAAQHAMGQAAPQNTQGANKTGWRLWVEFISEIGGDTPVLRRCEPGGEFRERFLKATFLIWCRSKCTSTVPNRSSVKPNTLLGHLYAVKRVHEANGFEFLTRGQTSQVIRFLAVEYELVHGPEALIPHKREGFAPNTVKTLIENVDGLKTTSRKYPNVLAGSWLARNIQAAIALSGFAGFRRAEISTIEGKDFTAMAMSRASLFFIIRSKVVRCPTAGELRSMTEGDKVGILAGPAKNDPLAVHFMPYPIIFGFFPWIRGDPGTVLRNLALYCPIPPSNLRRTPLFTSSANGDPLGYNFLAQVLKYLLDTIFPSEVAAKYSWHSFRIGLACALRAAQAPDWVLLALLRWRSPSSIPGYGRVSFEAAHTWLDLASQQSPSTIQATNLPPVEGDPQAVSIPNILSTDTYAYLDRPRALTVPSSELSAIATTLPAFDDDQFMEELTSFREPSSQIQ